MTSPKLFLPPEESGKHTKHVCHCTITTPAASCVLEEAPRPITCPEEWTEGRGGGGRWRGEAEGRGGGERWGGVYIGERREKDLGGLIASGEECQCLPSLSRLSLSEPVGGEHLS